VAAVAAAAAHSPSRIVSGATVKRSRVSPHHTNTYIRLTKHHYRFGNPPLLARASASRKSSPSAVLLLAGNTDYRPPTPTTKRTSAHYHKPISREGEELPRSASACVLRPRLRASSPPPRACNLICKVGRLPRAGQRGHPSIHPRPANRRGRSVPVGRPRGRRALSAAAAPAAKPSKRETKRKKRERETGIAVKSPPRPQVKEGKFLPVPTPAHPSIVKSSGWVPSFWSVTTAWPLLPVEHHHHPSSASTSLQAARSRHHPKRRTADIIIIIIIALPGCPPAVVAGAYVRKCSHAQDSSGHRHLHYTPRDASPYFHYSAAAATATATAAAQQHYRCAAIRHQPPSPPRPSART